jgi:replicative DNA helicase
MVASLTDKNSREVLELYRQGDAEIVAAYEKVFSAPIIWDERGSLSMAQIKNKLRRCSSKHSIKYAVLDHVGFIRLPAGKKNEELGKAIKEFKSECKELGIIPIIVVQLNRSATEEEPGLHHLKASGDIEEDASQVILLHRETLLTADERSMVAQGKALPIKAGVAKTRYGETGYKRLALFLHSSLIQDGYVDEQQIEESRA